MWAAGKFEPSIHYVRFPRYKNLAPGTKITFDHPITAIVGPNGVNKTSVLRALYGVPEGKSTGQYWFSTATDAIPGDRATCIHGRKQGDAIVEVLKQRSAADKTLDYWEPSRPIKAYGMSDMPEIDEGQPLVGRSKTRWDPINKNVVYIETSDRISAFDRCFHYAGSASGKPARKELIRRRAPALQRVIHEDLKSFSFYGLERVSRNVLLSAKEIQHVSAVLGRKYDEIRYVEHGLYQFEGATVVLKSAGLKYTEAFAGSGEFAVVQIVTSVLAAPEKSLVLIDEPETFLHPQAQSKLMDFLAEQSKLMKHQTVVTTHAPAIIRLLPAAAIKVLILSPAGEVELVAQAADPATAFFHIGEPILGKTFVYVEDELSKYIVTRVLGKDQAVRARFSVEPIAGGKSALWAFAAQFSTIKRKDVRLVLDGDARPADWPPKASSAIPEASIADYIKSLTGQEIAFHFDGGSAGGNQAQKVVLQRGFVDWIRQYVTFLPGGTPESLIRNRVEGTPGTDDSKQYFVELVSKLVDDPEVSSQSILTVQRELLAKHFASDDKEFKSLRTFFFGEQA